MHNRKRKAVFAIFETKDEAFKAVAKLESNGFKLADISLLAQERVGGCTMIHTKSSKAPEGAALGAGVGGFIGGTFGFIAGLGVIDISGLEPFLAAGPLMGALAGAGALGGAGAISGALIGFGLPEYEAKRYEGIITRGRALLSVHVTDDLESHRATYTLNQCGAIDVSTSVEIKPTWRQALTPHRQKDDLNREKIEQTINHFNFM